MKTIHEIDTKNIAEKSDRVLVRSNIKKDNGDLVAKASSYYYFSHKAAHIFISIVGTANKIQALVENIELDDLLDILHAKFNEECVTITDRYTVVNAFDKSIVTKTI